MKNNIYIYLFACLFGLSACKRDEVFEKEQYKNVFALISENADNVLQRFHDMEQPESTGYISASMGGTNPTAKTVTIQLAEDFSLLEEYNIAQYDVDVSKYYRPMPADKYDIESTTLVIPAGEIGGKIPLRIRPEGLSPDSGYFLAFRVVSFDACEINPEKSYLLYRVRIKNRWADGDGSTNYTMRGKLKIGTSEIEVPGVKIMMPISKNQVRVMAGNELYESNIITLRRGALVLEINEDYTVKIKPYANLSLTQMDDDPEYPNTFFVEDDGFKTYKTFLLHYKYTFQGTEKEIKEELRLEFNKKQDDYEW
ncbi:MAG: DUF4361 domain-containing protein [Tannerella sp.]|jgi:hypothetical protein|nr:DUF4361 domain-containing protein [Tannerella sp.]